MKNTLIALACGSAALAAQAQSSVTVFGVIDASVARIQGTGRGHIAGLSSGSESASRLGFKGTEDLGGGMAAGFWLESALTIDNGNAAGVTFQRRATVSLFAPAGELRLGRDYAPSYWNVSNFDPFGARSIAQNNNVTNYGIDTLRVSNAVQYVLPSTLGGVYGQAMYAFGEKQSNTRNDKQGDYAGARLGYAGGPLNVAVAYGRYKQVFGASDVAPLVTGGDLVKSNVGATWDFGFVRPSVYYGQERITGGGVAQSRTSALILGATAPLGAGVIRASVGRYAITGAQNDFRKYALGYGYNLSKRTQVYGIVAQLRNQALSTRALSNDGLASPGTAPGGRSSGFELGMRHSF